MTVSHFEVDTVSEERIIPRRERVRAMMREEILEAARRIVQERGFEGLAMRALGRAVGVTAPTLYDYFPSKEAVVSALFIRGVELLHREFDAAEKESQPGVDRLREIFNAYRQFGVQHPDLYQLMFGRIDPSFRPDEEAIHYAQTIPERAKAAAKEAMDLGEIRSGDVDTVCNALWVMAHGHVTLEICGFCEKKPQFDSALEMYQNNYWIMFNGLAPLPDGAPIPDAPQSFRNGTPAAIALAEVQSGDSSQSDGSAATSD